MPDLGGKEMPRIRDLRREEEERRSEEVGAGLPDLVLVGQDQLDGFLEGADETDEFEPKAPGIAFFPLGRKGYIGVPFCPPAPGGERCWPVSPGPDDNPFTWSCSCDVRPERPERPGPIRIPEDTRCSLAAGAVAGQGPLLQCGSVTCTGTCHLRVTQQKNGPIVFSCACH